MLYEESHRFVEFETMVVGENGAAVWAKSLEQPENLTLEEVRIMESLLWSFIEQLRGTYRLAELGLIEEKELLAVIQATVDADTIPVTEYIMGPSRSLQNKTGEQ